MNESGPLYVPLQVGKCVLINSAMIAQIYNDQIADLLDPVQRNLEVDMSYRFSFFVVNDSFCTVPPPYSSLPSL